MKTFNVLVVLLVFVFNANTADALTEKLQRGLFEEEANRNLDAAIKEYQSVVSQSDEQRKVMATALFRLGECYRKLGRTNEANAQYQRVLRDFSEHEQLVAIIRENHISRPAAEGRVESSGMSALERKEARLRLELTQANARLEALHKLPREKLLEAALLSSTDGKLAALQEQLRTTEQKLASAGATLGPVHAETLALTDLRRTILQQRDGALDGFLMAQKNRTMPLFEEWKAAQAELRSETATLTQAEAEELARVKALAQNSPDLLHRGLLQSAAQQGFVHVVRFLLEQGVSPNGDGEPPLYGAASRGHKGVVELLMEKGAKPNATSATFGTTALMAAAENGYASVVEALIKGGTDVNFSGPAIFISAQGPTALHRAVQNGYRRVIELLISSGAKLNVLSGSCNGCPSSWNQGVSPLHIAAGDRPELIELLLKAGADAKLTNFANKQPLSLAIQGRQSDAAMEPLLKSGSDPNLYATNGLNPLFLAVLNHRSNAVALLLQHGADPNARVRDPALEWGTPVIMRATTVGVLRQLIQAGADVNATNRSGYPALAQFVGNAEWATALLERGANPNVVFAEQSRPLHAAVYSLRPETVEALLKHGANPNVLDAKENSPLSIAENYASGVSTSGNTESERARTREKATDIVVLLKRHGANDFLRRAQSIGWSRDGKSSGAVFSRGTNAWNRYRLYEALAFTASGAAFPDFTRVTINRVQENTTTNLVMNLEEAFERKSCDKDVWLEWGDIVDIPEMDHRLNEQWKGLGEQRATTLTDCVKRTITIRTPEQTNEIQLVPAIAASQNESFEVNVAFATLPGFVLGQPEPPVVPKTLSLFRLKKVVFAANILRASSDISRVRVQRTNRETGKLEQQVWNLNEIQLSTDTQRKPAIPSDRDLWLRDGDVIEIPEKQ